ncbi:hypothetical protein [Gordonia otitidis]|uniref:Uncharacterized protein n=1 Tax=Gordonia otitidis (strain DSM 44809 / CCUG 52243 / JCM 12355 / NBRC 100426 / IFM 10032) TaxID=1108044 RepID=H5TRV6_GORO1|nr:hypothetical protein [Gordonia otitidis]GAB36214.1 hypothetical protein GOOTI_202_00700 [Gordonia otitidis NBRC 100426]
MPNTRTPIAISDLFTEIPDWIDFAEVPDGAEFFTRRGLPYSKSGRGSAVQLFDDDDVDVDVADDADVFDDWPYFAAPQRDERSA